MSATINASVPFASPLVLAERLIALAIDADQSGFSAAARRLVATAHSVLDRPGAAPSSRPTPSSEWPRTEELQASMVAVGLLPAQTATIHTRAVRRRQPEARQPGLGRPGALRDKPLGRALVPPARLLRPATRPFPPARPSGRCAAAVDPSRRKPAWRIERARLPGWHAPAERGRLAAVGQALDAEKKSGGKRGHDNHARDQRGDRCAQRAGASGSRGGHQGARRRHGVRPDERRHRGVRAPRSTRSASASAARGTRTRRSRWPKATPPRPAGSASR